MEKDERWIKVGFSRLFWAVLAVVLCATPILRADVTVPSGETWDIDYDVQGTDSTRTLEVLGTANVLLGAVITDGLLVGPEGTANIYGGSISPYINVDPDAVGIPLTVYGTDFAIDGSLVGYGEVTLTSGFGALTGYLGDETAINLLIGGPINLTINLQPPPSDVIEVTIDIKPGSYPNAINLGSHGVIPVAILSSETFDATTINPDTVSLAGSGVAVRGKSNKSLATLDDVNGDGLLDMIVKVETENLNPETFQNGSVVLTGQTTDGTEFTGSDSIIIVPPE